MQNLLINDFINEEYLKEKISFDNNFKAENYVPNFTGLYIDKKYMVDADNYRHSEYVKQSRRQDINFRKSSLIDNVIIHCNAVKENSFEKWENPETYLQYDLNPNHISKIGLPVCTYHFIVNRSGEIYQMLSMNIISAHCKGQNMNSIGICINHDGVNEKQITFEMYNSLIYTICNAFDFLDFSYDEYGVEEHFSFHREYANKLCPGKLNKDLMITQISRALLIFGDNI